MRGLVHKRWPLLAAALLLIGCGRGAAAEPIAAEHQVPIFLKILTYDRALAEAERDTVRIAVLQPAGDATADVCSAAIMLALEENAGKTLNGRPFSYVAMAYRDAADFAAATDAAAIDAIFLTCGNAENLVEITAHSRVRDILTFAGVDEYVAAGAAVGLTIAAGRPRILVNLPAVRAEGRDFPARFLQLCEVLK